MLRFVLFWLCISLTGATSFQKNATKVFLSKVKGSRIINGEQAQPGQFPFQAGLTITGDDQSWFCGGIIISDEWILTAGYCIEGARSGVALTGSLSSSDGLKSDLIEAVLHEAYDAENLRNDIGLVRLVSPLIFDSNTRPIRLSSRFLDENVEVTVSGWGSVSDDDVSRSDNLNFVRLVTVTKSECEDTYGLIGDEMICAKSGSDEVKSTCYGDSGDPVIVNSRISAELVAVASFVADSGCESDAPSGYTRTAYYREWIRDNTGV